MRNVIFLRFSTGWFCLLALFGVNTAFMPCSDLIVLRAGTSVSLVLQATIDPATVAEGMGVTMRVNGHVKINQKVLVADGAPASGVIIGIEKQKKPKCLILTILAERAQAVDGQQVSLTSADYVFRIACGEGTVSLNGTLEARVLNDIKIRG